LGYLTVVVPDRLDPSGLTSFVVDVGPSPMVEFLASKAAAARSREEEQGVVDLTARSLDMDSSGVQSSSESISFEEREKKEYLAQGFPWTHIEYQRISDIPPTINNIRVGSVWRCISSVSIIETRLAMDCCLEDFPGYVPKKPITEYRVRSSGSSAPSSLAFGGSNFSDSERGRRNGRPRRNMNRSNLRGRDSRRVRSEPELSSSSSDSDLRAAPHTGEYSPLDEDVYLSAVGVSEESSTTVRSPTATPSPFIVRRGTRVKRAVIASSFVGLATLAGAAEETKDFIF
jgi:hypothetical protein